MSQKRTNPQTFGYICFFKEEMSKEDAKKQAEQNFSTYQGGSEMQEIKRVKVYYDIHSGTNFDRPNWKALKNELQKGDELLVLSLESFSKTAFRLTLNEIDNLQKRGINFRVASLETETLWDYVLGFYDYFENIRLERQRLAIIAIGNNDELKKQKYPGRKTVLDAEFLGELQDLLKQNITSPTELSRKLNRSRSTIYKALNLLKEQGQIS